MKGVNKLRKFAEDLYGSNKSITDVIEALYLLEPEDERRLEVFASVKKYSLDDDEWVVDETGGSLPFPYTRERAISFLMMKDMENKWEPLGIHVYTSTKPWSDASVHISLVDRNADIPAFAFEPVSV